MGAALDNFSEGAGQTSDTRMIERALRERWPIKPEWRDAIIRRLMRVIADKNTSVRETISACRAILQADRLNIDATNTLAELQRLLDQIREAADNPTDRVYDWGNLSVAQLQALTDLGAMDDGDFFQVAPDDARGNEPAPPDGGEGTVP